jgi:hypothetical protein
MFGHALGPLLPDDPIQQSAVSDLRALVVLLEEVSDPCRKFIV